MDLTKSRDFFDPKKLTDTSHIIGCGSIGSHVAELLVRHGVKNLTLWDYDTVEAHNIANQLFFHDQINEEKTKALADILLRINPDLDITIKGRYEKEFLSGYVFLCLDSIEARQMVVDTNINNNTIITMTDFRTGFTEGQSYFVDWSSRINRKNFRKSMDFNDEEAAKNAPTTACGTVLGLSTVVKETAITGICNFTNFINNEETKFAVISTPYQFNTFTL